MVDPSQVDLPNIVTLGITGGGKSTINKFLSGGSEDFVVGDHLQSETNEFISGEYFLLGDSKNPKVRLYDTIGFQDNRGIDPDLFKKISQFIQSLLNGISRLLFVIPITSERLDISSFKIGIKLLGKEIFDSNKLILVYTQGGKLKEEFKEKAEKNYNDEAIKILKSNKIDVSKVEQVFYDNDPNLLAQKIIEKIQEADNSQFILPITKQILELKKASPQMTDEKLYFAAAKANPRTERFIKHTVAQYTDIYRYSEAVSKQNPDNEEDRKQYEKNKNMFLIFIKNIKELLEDLYGNVISTFSQLGKKIWDGVSVLKKYFT